MIAEFEADLAMIADNLGTLPYGLLTERARVPDTVRGYRPAKAEFVEKTRAYRANLLQRIEAGRTDTGDSREAAE